jgi:hypothetical protein
MEFGNEVFFETERDYLSELKLVLKKLKRKYVFEYKGIKFISNREIIGIEPETFKLIYKNEK